MTQSGDEGVVNGGVRVWLRAEGLAALVGSVVLYAQLGYRWWMFAALLLVPDLSMLGYLVNPKVGATSYNIVHSYLLPLGLMVFAMVTGRFYTVSLLCIWMAHIGMDRVLGFGLKYPAGFKFTHLGIAGGAKASE